MIRTQHGIECIFMASIYPGTLSSMVSYPPGLINVLLSWSPSIVKLARRERATTRA